MNDKNLKTILFALLFTALLIPTGIMVYAESNDIQTQQTSNMQNLKQAFNGIESSMIQNQSDDISARSVSGSSSTASDFVNLVMINEDTGELWVGIDRSEYSGGLNSFKNQLQNQYPDVNIRVEHADFQWHTCSSQTSNTCNPQVAGMEFEYMASTTTTKSATVGLAVQDANGKKGVVISAHTVGFGNTGQDIYSKIKGVNRSGTITSYDVHHGSVIKNTAADSSNVVPCDCAFVEFTKTNGVYNETVERNKIYRGSNTVYTVTGVHTPAHGDAIKIVGKSTGTHSTNIIGTNLTFIASDGITIKGTFATNQALRNGDSGASVFTTPNSSNEVSIVGMHSGTFEFGHSNPKVYVDVHMPWSKIATNLGLVAP